MSNYSMWFRYAGTSYTANGVTLDLSGEDVPVDSYVYCRVYNDKVVSWVDIGVDEKVVYMEINDGLLTYSTHASLVEGTRIRGIEESGFYILPVDLPCCEDDLWISAEVFTLPECAKALVSSCGVMALAMVIDGKFKICGLPECTSTLSKQLEENALVHVYIKYGKVVSVLENMRSRGYSFTVTSGKIKGNPTPILLEPLEDGKYSADITDSGLYVDRVFLYGPTGRWLFRKYE